MPEQGRNSAGRESPDRFVTHMWCAYRDAVPDQPAGATSRKCRAREGRWLASG